MHVPCLNACRSKTSEKIFTFYIENTKLLCIYGTADPDALQNKNNL